MKSLKSERLAMNKTQALAHLSQLWKFLYETRFKKIKSKKMKCPEFIIKKSKKFIAAYKVEMKNKTIERSYILINSTLFYKEEEWLLIEALLHEMAHQYCFEVKGKFDDFHGNLWKKVCKTIGCKASLSYPFSSQKPIINS